MPSPKNSTKAPMAQAPATKKRTSVPGKYASGQNSVKSGLCIATHLDGKPCMEPKADQWVPYCAKCMTHGDPSFGVEDHPKFGKMLVAKRDLPKNYYSALWGDRMGKNEMPEPDTEWGFETQYGDYVNPTAYKGSQVQFSQCPGPDERVTISFAPECIFMGGVSKDDKKKGEASKKAKGPTKKDAEKVSGSAKGSKENLGSFLFVTSMEVPKNHQLMMMYAENETQTIQFFKERGIVRSNIGTKTRPSILKKKALAKVGKDKK